MSDTSIERRIDRGRKALALARHKDLDTSQWEDDLQKLELSLQQAEELVRYTYQQFAVMGWCLWKCESLGAEVMVVTRDDKVTGIPTGLPVYTEAELIELHRGSLSRSIMRLVHEAKKRTTARVIPQTENKMEVLHEATESRPGKTKF